MGQVRQIRARDRLLVELSLLDVADPRAAAVLSALVDHPVSLHQAIVFDFLATVPMSTCTATPLRCWNWRQVRMSLVCW